MINKEQLIEKLEQLPDGTQLKFINDYEEEISINDVIQMDGQWFISEMNADFYFPEQQ